MPTATPDAAAAAAAPGPNPGEVRPDQPHREQVVTQAGPIRGSLFKQGAAAMTPAGPDGPPPPGGTAAPISFIAVLPAQARRYKKNDIVTVVIRQDSASTTTGSGTSKKTQAFDLALQEFIQLALNNSGLPQVTSVSNPSNLPEIKFNYNNDRQSDASQARQDSFSARMSAEIVDVKPNGTLVLQAVAHIVVDKEEQIFTLSGICRVEDIAADNTILSTQMADLNLCKQTHGEVRDGVKRGWLNKFIDTVNPF
jgi:flagellar L-ring protein precursor FlgH